MKVYSNHSLNIQTITLTFNRSVNSKERLQIYRSFMQNLKVLSFTHLCKGSHSSYQAGHWPDHQEQVGVSVLPKDKTEGCGNQIANHMRSGDPLDLLSHYCPSFSIETFLQRLIHLLIFLKHVTIHNSLILLFFCPLFCIFCLFALCLSFFIPLLLSIFTLRR